MPLRMGVHEFYQVNTPAAEVLYAKAREYAGLKPDDFLLDLYCGMGTIGLSMLADCKRLVGVEVVPQAVEGAKETAARLGLDADRADFRCQDAGAAAAQLAAESARPDVIVVDPPRKLRRGDPDRHCRYGPADRGYGQLQRRNSGKGCQVADRARI